MTLNLSEKQSEKTKCPHCEEEVAVEFEIKDIEAIDSTERGMGTETEYIFTEEVKCPNCNNTFEVEGSVWEYPEGVVNLVELR